MLRGHERVTVKPEDLLNEKEYQLLKDARAGKILCPTPGCNNRPLTGSFYFFVSSTGIQYKGVRLTCSGCGLDEP